ncbi:MAG: FixH family protein [Bacteroidetes bacterium]|nr:FixH family protein [Bacteroidota bacterium]
MNWGLRIAILYIGFVALILTLVFTSMNNKEDLVSADYYAQELKYQNRIDATNNANLAQASIDVTVLGNDIELSVPSEFNQGDLTGEILFFRPSDAGKDVKVSLKPDANGKQLLHNIGLVHGAYKVQLSWTSKGKAYYKESSVFIP